MIDIPTGNATELVIAWNLAHGPGTRVVLTNDHGEIEHTKTRSEAWVAGVQPLVSVEGRTGGYSLWRIRVTAREANQSMQGEIDDLRARLAEATEQWIAQVEQQRTRAERAEANYQFMVDRACNEKLDGYRELGAESLVNLERAERAEAEVKRLRDGIAAILADHNVVLVRDLHVTLVQIGRELDDLLEPKP